MGCWLDLLLRGFGQDAFGLLVYGLTCCPMRTTLACHILTHSVSDSSLLYNTFLFDALLLGLDPDTARIILSMTSATRLVILKQALCLLLTGFYGIQIPLPTVGGRYQKSGREAWIPSIGANGCSFSAFSKQERMLLASRLLHSVMRYWIVSKLYY